MAVVCGFDLIKSACSNNKLGKLSDEFEPLSKLSFLNCSQNLLSEVRLRMSSLVVLDLSDNAVRAHAVLSLSVSFSFHLQLSFRLTETSEPLFSVYSFLSLRSFSPSLSALSASLFEHTLIHCSCVACDIAAAQRPALAPLPQPLAQSSRDDGAGVRLPGSVRLTGRLRFVQ